VAWIARFDSLDWDELASVEPEFNGLLFRRAQYDDNNYTEVQPRLRDLLSKSDSSVRHFANRYVGHWAVDGLDKLVPDMYWLYERMKTARADPIAKEKIQERFGSSITTGPPVSDRTGQVG
jgi:hypothetical protein